MQEEYYLPSNILYDFSIDCIFLSVKIETNIESVKDLSVEDIKNDVICRGKLRSILKNLNHTDYLIRFYKEVAIPEYNVEENLIFQFNNFNSNIYFMSHLDPKNLNLLIYKYKLEKKIYGEQ